MMENNESENLSTNNNAVPMPVTRLTHTEREDDDDRSVTSIEIFTERLDLPENQADNTVPRVKLDNEETIFNIRTSAVPSTLIKQIQTPIINQPLRISSNLPSPMSIDMLISNQPLPLFLQALAKLNESSLSLAMNDKRINNPQFWFNNTRHYSEITPPDSLTSAPPSYSFVLRQMAAVRRRPRLMGTFIPSPSYIQHTPPPNYATAFDIYVDNPLPPPPTRAYNFGFTPIPIVCPECGYTGMTIIASKITLCTHLCAVILCLLCCWICAPLPYLLRSCKDVYHYCRNCRNYLGMYCPTNPESTYP